ncbi:MAG TPA: biotin transporter BioY, partial [Jiangellales bacterium]|nr:biotin transporter BioY [Jiangellales bacterium]
MTRRWAPLTAQDLARVAVFAALIAVLGLPGTIVLFGGAVPVTAQTLGVMLAGAVLGARRGFLAALTFCVLVLAGLPLLAGGRGGLGVLAGPSAGYFLAFPMAALVVGLIVQRRLPRPSIPWVFLACVVGGIGVVYAVGVPVLAWRADLDLRAAVVTGALVFLPGDLLKAA